VSTIAGTASAAGIPRRPDDARRARLIERLEEIFLAEGFSLLTVDDLCRRLHCSKSTLYTVASTKQQIVQAAVRRFFATATTAVEEASRAEKDPARRIRVYLHTIGTEMARSSPEFYLDLVNYQPTADIYLANTAAATRRVRELIEDGVRSGAFRPTDATFTAQLVALAIDGVRSGRLLAATGLTAGEAFVELGDFMLRGLSR
jgi:AcrR family transcriptional regulator